MKKNKEVLLQFESEGEFYLNEILTKCNELQVLADREERSVTAVFGEICEHILLMGEEKQIRILDEMFVSKKFSIFFTLTRETLIKKELGFQFDEIKKIIRRKFGLPPHYLKYVDLISKSILLKKEVSKYFELWSELPIDYDSKKRRTSGYQTVHSSHY